MTRVNVSLASVDTKRRCGKPNCKTGSHTFNRHHRKHQGMWLGIWQRRRRGEAEWKKFVDRYYQFHPEDWSYVCEHHHAEIHQIYDFIIQLHRDLLRKNLVDYTWAEAHELMDKLEQAFWEWYPQESPGIRSEAFRRNRLTKARPDESEHSGRLHKRSRSRGHGRHR